MDVRLSEVNPGPVADRLPAVVAPPVPGLSSNVVRVDFAQRAKERRQLRQIFELAALVDLDEAHILVWFRTEQIAELGHRTAEELFQAGYACAVTRYLMAIIAGDRG